MRPMPNRAMTGPDRTDPASGPCPPPPFSVTGVRKLLHGAAPSAYCFRLPPGPIYAGPGSTVDAMTRMPLSNGEQAVTLEQVSQRSRGY